MTQPASSDPRKSLFGKIRWRDSLSGKPLDPIVFARNLSEVTVSGALKVQGEEHLTEKSVRPMVRFFKDCHCQQILLSLASVTVALFYANRL